MNRKKNIIAIVAHPDDESLWIGGTLAGLSRSGVCHVYIVCMTGKNDPLRSVEFVRAMQYINPENYMLADQAIPKRWGIDIENIEDNIERSLHKFGLKDGEIDLLITHSFYGDEHQHPNHKQLFRDVKKFASERQISFAFFSFMPVSKVMLNPILTDAKRGFGLHLVCVAECIVGEQLSMPGLVEQPPSYFFQFKVDHELKHKMLGCYESINIEQHRAAYSAWDSDMESIYVTDKNGFDCFMSVYQQMNRPHGSGACLF